MSVTAERVTSVSVTVGGQEIVFETGKLAKQADGAVLVRSGETMVLATAQGKMEGREGAEVLWRQMGGPRRLAQHALNHHGIDVDQRVLEQVEGEHGDFLRVTPIRGEVATIPKENEIIGTIPVLHDVGSCT